MIAIGRDPSSLAMSASRVFGVAVMLSIARVSLASGLAPGVLTVTIQCIFVGLVAVLVGNIAKELAIELFTRIFGWMRRDFRRTGVMLNGAAYRKTIHPDGTWIRCEYGPAGTICEWTDPSGACNRIVTGPRRQP